MQLALFYFKLCTTFFLRRNSKFTTDITQEQKQGHKTNLFLRKIMKNTLIIDVSCLQWNYSISLCGMSSFTRTRTKHCKSMTLGHFYVVSLRIKLVIVSDKYYIARVW